MAKQGCARSVGTEPEWQGDPEMRLEKDTARIKMSAVQVRRGFDWPVGGHSRFATLH